MTVARIDEVHPPESLPKIDSRLSPAAERDDLPRPLTLRTATIPAAPAPSSSPSPVTVPAPRTGHDRPAPGGPGRSRSWRTAAGQLLRRIGPEHGGRDRSPAQLVTLVSLILTEATLCVTAVQAARAGDLPLASGLLAVAAIDVTVFLPSYPYTSPRVSGIERAVRAQRPVGAATVALTVAHLVVTAEAGRQLPGPATLLPPLAHPGVTAVVISVVMVALALPSRGTPADRRLRRALQSVLFLALSAVAVLSTAWLARSGGHVLALLGVLAMTSNVGRVLTRRGIVPNTRSRVAFVVQNLRVGPDQLTTLVLKPVHSGGRLSFRPGQVAWLHLDHRQGPRLSQPVTISSGTGDERLEFAVDGGQAAMARLLLRPGRPVYLDGPHDPWDDGHQGSLLLVADRAGVAAALSILRTQASRQDPRPHCLIVGVRVAADLTCRRELKELARQLDLDVVEILSNPGPTWTGRRGRVDASLLLEVLEQYPSLSAPHVYACGTNRLLADVRLAFLGLGLPSSRIHVQRTALSLPSEI